MKGRTGGGVSSSGSALCSSATSNLDFGSCLHSPCHSVSKNCSTTKYREGSCWRCPCSRTTSVRTDSVLQNSNISYGNFILLLNAFAESVPISRAAETIRLSENTIRHFYQTIREQIAADVQTSSKIGGPGTIVEVDEAKFGKRKYNRGRMVHGSWVLGGIQRGSDSCFLTICPENL